MNRFSVNLKCSDKSRSAWQCILSIFREVNIKCSKLDATNEGFKAFMSSESDIDMLFFEGTLNKLSEMRCSPIKPSFLRTNRTIILKNVDRFIMEHSEADLIENINEFNKEYLAVVSLFKFPSGKTLKFECRTSEMAAKCLDKGLVLFNLSINPQFLALEECLEGEYCYRCYSINNHKSSSCTKPSDFVICSLCASSMHTYRDCTSNDRKCINCMGKHATMSKACPKLRETLSVKHDVPRDGRVADSAAKLYSQCLSEKHPESLGGASMKRGLSREDMFTGYMSLLLATNIEVTRPGSFRENLTKLLKANGLPDFHTADLVPSNPFPVGPQNFFSDPTQIVNSEIENLSGKVQSGVVSDRIPDDSVQTGLNIPEKSGEDGGTKSRLRKSTIETFCKLYVRQTEKQKLSKGKKLIDGINSSDIAIEHSCSDEVKCIQNLSKKIHKGDHTCLSITDLPNRRFEEKYAVLMGDQCQK